MNTVIDENFKLKKHPRTRKKLNRKNRRSLRNELKDIARNYDGNAGKEYGKEESE